MKSAVIIMSRVPEPGFTKTRLLERLSGDECADLHRACLRDICLAVRNTRIDAFIYYAGSTNTQPETDWIHPGMDPWNLRPEDYLYFTMCQQKGIHLGERMLNAAYEILSVYDAVIFLGSDMPCLTPVMLQETQERLQTHDMVIGPAEDGGYYLLGIKKLHKELFHNIPWSTRDVLDVTLQTAEKNGLSHYMLAWQRDLDTWSDLVVFYETGLNNEGYAKLDSYRYAKYLLGKSGCLERNERFE